MKCGSPSWLATWTEGGNKLAVKQYAVFPEWGSVPPGNLYVLELQ